MSPIQVACYFSLIVMATAFVLSVARLIKGPSLADRVLALDILAVLSALIMAVLAVQTKNPMLMEATLVISLLAFMSTLAFARYINS